MAVLLGLNGLRLRYSEDLIDLLPSDDPIVRDHKEVVKNFNPLDNLYVDIHTTSAAINSDDLIEIGDSFVEKLEASGLFDRISYKWSMNDVSGVIDVLRQHRGVMFAESDEAMITERLAPANVLQTLRGWKETLIASPVPFISQSFFADPIGLDQIFYKKLEKVQSFGSAMSFHKGRLFSKDLKHLLILLSPKKRSTDIEFSGKLVTFVDTLIDQSRKPGVTFSYLGGHRYALLNSTIMKTDVGFASTLSTVLIIALSFLIFRRRGLPFLVILSAAFGAVFAYGLMPFISPQVSLIAIGCGSMLFGIAVDYATHLLFHLDQYEKFDEKTVVKVMKLVLPPLFLSAITTTSAFICLQFSILPAYHQFGQFAAFGIAGSLLFTVVVIPTFLIGMKKSKRQARLAIPNFFPRYYQYIQRHWLGAFALVIGFTIFCSFGLPRLRFDGEVRNLYATTPAIEADMQTINSSFGDAIKSTSLVVRSQDLESALEENDHLSAKLGELQEKGWIQSYHSLATMLPSKSQQQRNRQRWEELWTKDLLGDLERHLNSAASALRIRPEAFTDFLGSLPGASPFLTIADYKDTFLEPMFANQVSQKKGVTLVLSNLKLNEAENFKRVLSELIKSFPDLICVNARYFVDHIVKLINNELIRLGLITSIVVVVLLTLFYGFRAGLPMLTPLIVTLLWTFGIMGWLDIPINMMNCVIVLFIFGLVIDYSVFFSSAFYATADPANDPHLARSGAAIIICSATTIFGIGALAIARHPALYSVGITILLGVSIGLASVLILIPLNSRLAAALNRRR